MAEVKNKTYIMDQWKAAGLIDRADIDEATRLQKARYEIAKLTKGLKFAKDKDSIRQKLNEQKLMAQYIKERLRKVWRIEFSLKSAIKGFVRTIDHEP